MNEGNGLLDFVKIMKESRAHKSVTYSKEKRKLHLLQRNMSHSIDNSSQINPQEFAINHACPNSLQQKVTPDQITYK